MKVYDHYPFLRQRFASGQFSWLLNRHLPIVAYFARNHQLPLQPIIEDLVALVFTDRFIALNRYSEGQLIKSIYKGQKITGADPGLIKALHEEEKLLLAILVIHLKNHHRMDHTRCCQLDGLIHLLTAWKIIYGKNWQTISLITVPKLLTGISNPDRMQKDVNRLLETYHSNDSRLYRIKDKGAWYIKLTSGLADFIVAFSKREAEIIDEKFKKFLAAAYAEFNKQVILQNHIKKQAGAAPAITEEIIPELDS